ncbi:unnamed protein product, partial [Cyprideis torosa]
TPSARPAIPPPQNAATLNKAAKPKQPKRGYILFSSHTYHRFEKENPQANFTELSKIMGELPPCEREDASSSNQPPSSSTSLNEGAHVGGSGGSVGGSPSSSQTAASTFMYSCELVDCTRVFPDSVELISHFTEHGITFEGNVLPPEGQQFLCPWRGCTRPFPDMKKLVTHLKNIHILKQERLKRAYLSGQIVASETVTSTNNEEVPSSSNQSAVKHESEAPPPMSHAPPAPEEKEVGLRPKMEPSDG